MFIGLKRKLSSRPLQAVSELKKKSRKLNFVKVKKYDDPKETDIVYPIDEETGEEISDVVACSVETHVDNPTKMTIVVEIRNEDCS